MKKELVQSYVMLRKAIKILSVIAIMWIVSLLTIMKEYKGNTKMVLIERDNSYEKALDKFRRSYENGSTDFRVWQILPFANTGLTDYEKDNIIKGYEYPPGGDGRPVVLENNLRYYIRQEIHKGWRDHAFNKFVSDLIPVNRTLLDPRDPWCKEQNYSTDLPKVTVIICFYDEAWSTLIRTVTSVLNRSPPELLDQIILVDDHSTMAHLKKQLDDYVRITPKVTLLRATSREGIVRARLMPMKYVKTPVVFYLDSHCECAQGWLEPLLERIKNNPNAVVSPVLDHIHETTFEYIAQETDDLRLGGFNWDLRFSWIGIPQEELDKRKNPAAPIATPTISGGLFAINKDFFEKLGYYDEEFEIWGAENLELSFKTWMCGGKLEIVPCSHVGHLFRKRIPYEQTKKSLKKNFVRLAEVWLDDYAKYYYERIGNDKGEYGNLSSRFELRKKLKCKPFKWYIDNVYPQIEMPDKYVASGQIYSAGNSGLCLDACISLEHYQEPVKILPCHFEGGNQSQVIRHMATEQCLNIGQFPEGLSLVLTQCSASVTQRWVIEHFKYEKLAPQVQIGLSEWEKLTNL
ncbi:putative polypeptide N-acetylgalactosaminyltransferase 9 isoform X2 [Trichoplusia ni]|uniref:Polypeptide N-acetylgalactosaminyltransferase n=1 Tax=Trichoplusia ni TaxID=7111 RepID=A0A7E5W2J2_TRINI|nr:putative polypeptide N-acetylgalactosaminyltransferase 9 isoform X2 [Trichoplusia ni]